MRVLVTGGAGYIGSHMAHLLRRQKHHVVVMDDLSGGQLGTVPADLPFVGANVGDEGRVSLALREHRIEAVFHFAGRIQVAQSIERPRLYFTENLAASIALLECVLDAGIKYFVFSSTAAVYGSPIQVPIDEEHPTVPVSPYGETKLGIERALFAYTRAYDLFRYVSLRYFNAAGADVDAGLRERHSPETHLIPIALEAALGRLNHVTVYGKDYDTPDGTCIRDYVHVSDLCEAHLVALDYLTKGGESGVFNLGTGIGHSVTEVIESVQRVTGRVVPIAYGARRVGDPPILIASVKKAQQVLEWRARRTSLDRIVRDAWEVVR